LNLIITMIYDIGCPLSISQLAQIIDRMQNSEQYRKHAFRMNTGRKGGVLIEDKLNRFKVNLCKSIYDSWPFIPDNELSHLYKEKNVLVRWGLQSHTVTSVRIDNFEELVQAETTIIELLLRHIKIYAYFCTWNRNILHNNSSKKYELCIF